MQYFDLNIPYLESEKSISDKSTKKQTRLKQIVKLMEFGYCGIAYNRTIKGAMCESDRCTISPFPLTSLLNHSPSLYANVSLHRRLLGVPENGAFRQYTRLTMVVETSAQASALNSGNPILKTYDLIAVIPMNQNSFDIACQSSQVDLISIDFGEKLPFRLKLPMVKAAIARGVYFEIMYSSLMQDIQVRRQLISNAKLLVEWTRGKNLIVSSAAPSVLELRGPNDVANLLSLLGLTNEFAKATISKNCRLLIADALRRKQFHKEAIKVEEMPPVSQTDSKEPWIVDHIGWDPLSSGEGDLLLNDMAKAFAASGKVSQTLKSPDFSSLGDSVQSHGLQVNNSRFKTEGHTSSGDFTGFISPSKDTEVSKKTEKRQNEPTLHSSLFDNEDNTAENFQQAVIRDFPMVSSDVEGSIALQDLKKFDSLETSSSPNSLHELEMQNHVLTSNSMKEATSKVDDLEGECIAGSRTEVLTVSESPNCDGAQLDSDECSRGDAGISTELHFSDQLDFSIFPGNTSPEVIEYPVAGKTSSLQATNVKNLNHHFQRSNGGLLLGNEKPLEEVIERKKNHTEGNLDTKELADADGKMLMDPFQQERSVNDLSLAKSMLLDDTMMECRKQVQEMGETAYQSSVLRIKSGTKLKRQDTGQFFMFPFKRLLQVNFKNNGRTSKYKSKSKKRK